MAEVLGFRGLRYDLARAGDGSALVCPPYDVIEDGFQQELYRRSPYNVVRVEFGGVLPADDDRENRYSRADRYLGSWMGLGVLCQDDTPGLYLCEEDYRGEFGEMVTRRGFVGAVRLEDPGSGVYHPHERTHAGPKVDRIRLMRACRANLSPIFSLYDDPEETVERALENGKRTAEPLMTVRSDDGVTTRMWRVSDPAVVSAVTHGMAGRPFFIADGHHRYETALQYRDEMRGRHPDSGDDAPWNCVMMYLSNLRSSGLTVFPAHRAVFGVPSFDPRSLLETLGRGFEVQPVGSDADLMEGLRGLRAKGQGFGLVLPGGEPSRLLTLRDEAIFHRPPLDGLPEVVRRLDVSILHTLILEGMLGIDRQAQTDQRNLRYVKGHEALLEQVRGDREIQCGFLMNPTPVEQVKEVSLLGERMPQKSTYFYPKMLTGLVLRLLYDPETPRP